jgi:hypothetical protein
VAQGKVHDPTPIFPIVLPFIFLRLALNLWFADAVIGLFVFACFYLLKVAVPA